METPDLDVTGRAEPYKNTGKFIALEAGTNKPIRKDGSLGGSFDPPLHESEDDALSAIRARKEKNEKYAAENTPEKQAEKKAEREQERERYRLEREKSIKDALAITPSAGYLISDMGNGAIKVSGKFDEELHKRLKRAGAGWDTFEKAWLMQYGKAEEIENFIIKNGEYPKSDKPEGKTVLNSHNIYGSGYSFVIGDQYIWYVRGHSMDGDDWSQNNSGGNMVWRITYNKEIANKLVEADNITRGLK